MSGHDHTSGRTVASPTHTDGFGDNRAPSSTATDYRTSIHFLTSPSSTSTAVGSEMDDKSGAAGSVPVSSVPVSTLLADTGRGYSYAEPRRNPVSLPSIHAATGPKYREDELTGMAGLMELSAPKPAHSMDARPMHARPMGEADSSSASSNVSRSVPQPMGAVATPQYTGQAYYGQYAAYGPPRFGATPLTPESQPGTRSFPTIDDVQGARRRSQSTDSMQTHGAYTNALPHVLGNANIRNRAMTTTQRQRTSDTPLFPVLLHRIITDVHNEAWIRWCDDGQAFKFSSADNLLACLQAAGLRAQNYHSVEKNLNDYRFTRLTDQRRKIPDLDGRLWWMFSHPQFLRDHPDGIVNIQRRRRTNPPAVSPQPALTQPAMPQYPPMQGHDSWM
ncbi:sequence-specific DNA binding [Coemansia sp. RSA 1822]|nr:sequence-specific DNA binding [Coemansia sp. RSA 638]KAJ2566997.1 sequence-specific DNA binding [Coemansia sp. RSA 1822]